MATIGHVGDTRLYKLRDGHIEKITRDHSPVGEREDAREISERHAMRHPRRNEVYRDVGSEPHAPDDPEFVDLLEIPFDPGDALLLCSDGLSDLVESSAILDVVNEHAGNPHAVVHGLIDAANAAGGKDNVTVVYIEGDRVGRSVARPNTPRRRRGVIIATIIGLGLAAHRVSHRLSVRSAMSRRWIGRPPSSRRSICRPRPSGLANRSPPRSSGRSPAARSSSSLANTASKYADEKRPSGQPHPPRCDDSTAGHRLRHKSRSGRGCHRIGERSLWWIPYRRRCANPARRRHPHREALASPSSTSRCRAQRRPRCRSLAIGQRELISSDIHDNPGAALAIQAGARPASPITSSTGTACHRTRPRHSP